MTGDGARHNLPRLMAPAGKARAQWLAQSSSLLLRLVGNDSASEAVSTPLIVEHLNAGVFPDIQHDAQRSDLNVLLAFLSSQFNTLNFGEQVSLPSPMEADKQHLAQVLVAQGCDPAQTSTVLEGADALDYAFANNATGLLRQWIGDTPWQERSIENLPWAHWAARSGMIDMLHLLDQKGMDPDQDDAQGNSPLFYATSPEVVQCLVELGADTSHQNHNGMDALAYWQSRDRKVTGVYLTNMREAIGPVQAPEKKIAFKQFIEMTRTGGTSHLVKEARRLGIEGNEKDEEGGILTAATERAVNIIGHAKVEFGGPPNEAKKQMARRWLQEVCRWKKPYEAASDEDIGLLIVITKCDYLRSTTPPEAEARLEERGTNLSQAILMGMRKMARLLDEELGEQLDMTKTVNHALYSMLSEAEGFMDGNGDTLVWLLNHTKDFYMEETVSNPLIKRLILEPDGAQGWKTEGLLSSLMEFGLGNSSYTVRRDFLDVARKAARNGAPWDEKINDLISLGDTEHHEEVLADILREALTATTLKANPRVTSRAPRL